MAPRSDARERMISSAAQLLRERGVRGTAFSDVLEHSGAPRGSVYHHFPNGKSQLVTEATRWTSDAMTEGFVALLERGDPGTSLSAFIESWVGILQASDFQAGCPMVAVTVDGDDVPEARALAGETFVRFAALLTEALRARGCDPDGARDLATMAVASIEGAIVLARAQRDTGPLDAVSRALERMIAASLPA